MAAEARSRLNFVLSGLESQMEMALNVATTTTPTRKFSNYIVQAVADTSEALTFGDIGTVHLLIINSVTNDVQVDLDFVSSFDADLEIPAGEFAVIPKPAGTVHIKNADSSEQVTVEIMAVGVA